MRDASLGRCTVTPSSWWSPRAPGRQHSCGSDCSSPTSSARSAAPHPPEPSPARG